MNDMDMQLEALGAEFSYCEEECRSWLCTYHLNGAHIASGDQIYAIWDNKHVLCEELGYGVDDARLAWRMWEAKYFAGVWEAR